MENALIIGLGGIGGTYALLLSRSNKTRISTIARTNAAIVSQDGLRVQSSIFGDTTLKFDAVNPDSSDDGDGFSYILVTTKALPNSTPSLVETLEPYVRGKTCIVLIQNGVGIEDRVRERWPQNVILTCVAWIGAIQTSPGIIVHHVGVATTLGPFDTTPPQQPSSREYSETQERLSKFAEMLQLGGGTVDLKHDHVSMQVERWKKVAWNAAWNSCTALTDLDVTSFLLSSPSAEPTARRLIREIISVAHGLGIVIDPSTREAGTLNLEDTLLERVKAKPMTTSMRQDAQHKRAMEIEVILGVPLRKAKALGLNTPVLEMLYALLYAIDERNAGRIVTIL